MWHMKHESFTYWKKNTSNRVKKKKISTLNVQTVKWSNNGVSIHAFNKSGHHLEFSMNDVIRGKIIHMAKMATKDESSVDIDFAVCSYKKRNVFTLYQEEYFLHTMSLWVCHRNFKVFVRRYSWINEKEGKQELIWMQKKKCELKFWLNHRGLREQTWACLLPR